MNQLIHRKGRLRMLSGSADESRASCPQTLKSSSGCRIRPQFPGLLPSRRLDSDAERALPRLILAPQGQATALRTRVRLRRDGTGRARRACPLALVRAVDSPCRLAGPAPLLLRSCGRHGRHAFSFPGSSSVGNRHRLVPSAVLPAHMRMHVFSTPMGCARFLHES